jgi:hypothetical protein
VKSGCDTTDRWVGTGVCCRLNLALDDIPFCVAISSGFLATLQILQAPRGFGVESVASTYHSSARLGSPARCFIGFYVIPHRLLSKGIVVLVTGLVKFMSNGCREGFGCNMAV